MLMNIRRENTAKRVTEKRHEWRILKAEVQKHLRGDRQARYDGLVARLEDHTKKNQMSAVWTTIARLGGEKQVSHAVLKEHGERCKTDKMAAEALSEQKVRSTKAEYKPHTTTSPPSNHSRT